MSGGVTGRPFTPPSQRGPDKSERPETPRTPKHLPEREGLGDRMETGASDGLYDAYKRNQTLPSTSGGSLDSQSSQDSGISLDDSPRENATASENNKEASRASTKPKVKTKRKKTTPEPPKSNALEKLTDDVNERTGRITQKMRGRDAQYKVFRDGIPEPETLQTTVKDMIKGASGPKAKAGIVKDIVLTLSKGIIQQEGGALDITTDFTLAEALYNVLKETKQVDTARNYLHDMASYGKGSSAKELYVQLTALVLKDSSNPREIFGETILDGKRHLKGKVEKRKIQDIDNIGKRLIEVVRGGIEGWPEDVQGKVKMNFFKAMKTLVDQKGVTIESVLKGIRKEDIPMMTAVLLEADPPVLTHLFESREVVEGEVKRSNVQRSRTDTEQEIEALDETVRHGIDSTFSGTRPRAEDYSAKEKEALDIRNGAQRERMIETLMQLQEAGYETLILEAGKQTMAETAVGVTGETVEGSLKIETLKTYLVAQIQIEKDVTTTRQDRGASRGEENAASKKESRAEKALRLGKISRMEALHELLLKIAPDKKESDGSAV